jgi:elongation factor Ts
MITAQMVKDLRETTGCGMMDCKKALNETNGDMEKAMDYLREKGLAAAEKKAGRIAAEGIVSDFVSGNVGVIIEVNSETDFVAKNADFQAFVKGLAEVVATNNPATVEDLLKLKYVASDMLVEEVLREKILTIGENMTIRRFERYEGPVATYIHGGGRIGVIVLAQNSLDGDSYDAARDAAMQIAAINPRYLDKADVPSEDIQKEKEILVAQIKNDPKTANKPDNIIEKMVEGKISKFCNINCLNQQEFVKDPDTTVEKYLASKNVKIVKFQRFEKGEGLEKKEDNFADEVANMSK